MAKIPIFCENCGELSTFNNLIDIADGANVKINFSGNKASCSNCGKLAVIVDGTYEFIGNTLEIFKSSKVTNSQLKRLIKILANASDNKMTGKEISQNIVNEVPELSKLSDLIPKKSSEVNQWISIIIALVSLYIGYLNYQEGLKRKSQASSSSTTVNITNNESNSLNKTSVSNTKIPQITKPFNKKKKQGVNQPCFCGSGKKFKKCHK